jgi:hypothetical protein
MKKQSTRIMGRGTSTEPTRTILWVTLPKLWLGDEDSNLSSRVQSPLSYR